MTDFVCRQCRQPLKENDAFCRACGAAHSADNAGTAAAPPLSVSSPTRKLFIGNIRHPLFWPFLVTLLLLTPVLVVTLPSAINQRMLMARRDAEEDADIALWRKEQQTQGASPASAANSTKQADAGTKKTTVAPSAPITEPSPSAKENAEDGAGNTPLPELDTKVEKEPQAEPTNIPRHVTFVDTPSQLEKDKAVLQREVQAYADLLAEMARIIQESGDANAFAQLKTKAEKQHQKVIHLPSFDNFYEETNAVTDRNGDEMTWTDGTPARFIVPKT